MTTATDRRLMILLENEPACDTQAKLMRLESDPTVHHRKAITNALRESLGNSPSYLRRSGTEQQLENAVRHISLPEGVTFHSVAVTENPTDPEAYVIEARVNVPRPLDYITVNLEVTTEDEE